MRMTNNYALSSMPRRRLTLESLLKQIKQRDFLFVAAVYVAAQRFGKILICCPSYPEGWRCGLCTRILILRIGFKCKCGARVAEIEKPVHWQRFQQARERIINSWERFTQST